MAEDVEMSDDIPIDEETAKLLEEAIGRGPNEDGVFILTDEETKRIFIDPFDNLNDLYSEDSDLNDL